MISLQIGSWKHEIDSKQSSKSRLKVLFSKRKFVYEIEVNGVMPEQNVKQVANIDVPFRYVSNIHFTENEMKLEVLHPPFMYLGKQELIDPTHPVSTAKHDKPRLIDFTDGQLSQSPYHKIVFRDLICTRLKESLIDFDNKFENLTSLVYVEVSDKKLKPEIYHLPMQQKKKSDIIVPPKPKVVPRKRRRSSQRLDSDDDGLTDFPGCMCRKLCGSRKCSCVKLNISCTEKCNCNLESCKNTFTTLSSMGYNMKDIRNDPCFMRYIIIGMKEGISLATQLEIEVELPCCNNRSKVKDLIPGTVDCKHCRDPVNKLEYSWCFREVSMYKGYRKHCIACKSCINDEDQFHCKKCGTCCISGQQSLEVNKCSCCEENKKQKQN
ncbi:uncharacterized protein LOC102808857 [Saccoglossus kowalevskii]